MITRTVIAIMPAITRLNCRMVVFEAMSVMHAISPYLRYNRVDNYGSRKDQEIWNGFFGGKPFNKT
jgi:hypothetical protein